MLTILVLIHVVLHSFLFLLIVCEKSTGMSPFGEPIGPLGPTIVEKSKPSVDDDVTAFNKHVGEKDLNPIVQLIASRTLAQRLAIADAYQKRFPTNVTIDINSVLKTLVKWHPDPQDFFKGFFIALPEYLARRIQYSLDLKAHWTYMSIICTSTATRLKAIVIAYSKVYMKELRDELDKQLSDPEGAMVLKQMVDPRYVRPDSGTDLGSVDRQVNFIPSDTVNCNNNTDLFNLMTSQSFQQLRLVSDAFERKNNNAAKVVDMFRKHCRKGDLQEVYKRIIRYASDPYEYYAEEYYLAMVGNDRNINAEQYVITTRNEVDLKDVLKAYKIKYKKDPIELVTKWSDDQYKNLFLAILKGNN